MKIIDLLNKIANGEEVPKKIKYLNYEYEFNQVAEEYQRWFDGVSYGLGEDRRLDIILDEEVEILEEEKKIPENLPFNNDMKLTIMEVYHELEKYNYKINEIIDYLKSKGDE